MTKNLLRMVILWSMALWLGACSGGAVVFVPTPLPPDASPTLYTHPTGAFRLVLPRDWSVYEQSGVPVAVASFAPPNSATPLVRVAVVNLGSPIELSQFGEMMLQYQTQIRADVGDYTEQDRQPMSDGSWRIAGIRTVAGKPELLNTFLQRNGSLFSVLETIVPQDAQRLSDVQLFINTYELNESAQLPPTALTALASVGQAQLEIINVATWLSPYGVFFITGEVANRSAFPYSGVPIRALLQDSVGTTVLQAEDKVMGHSIPPNGFAPFSLRFGEGQPLQASEYVLTLGGADWQADTLLTVSAPILTWTDALVRGTDGQLYITGEMTNTGEQRLKEPMVTVTVFDDNGRVIGAGFAPVQSAELASGDTASYTVLISEVGGDPANYIVNGQALADEE